MRSGFLQIGTIKHVSTISDNCCLFENSIWN